MANLWDRVHQTPQAAEFDAETEAFDVSDILRVHHESHDDSFQYAWDELPNIAPPFRQFFMFGKVPVMRANGQEVHLGSTAELGCFFKAFKRPDGWDITAHMVGGPGKPFWQQGIVKYHVQPDGRFGRLNDQQGRGREFALLGPAEYLRELTSNISPEDAVAGYSGYMYPFVLATSLLHCKNVSAKRVPIDAKLARANERRGRPSYSYSVLDIAPMRRTLESEGGLGHGSTLAKAMHMCRGHFKDYRDGAGLFGRHRGIYWWEQALRGDPSAGVHETDYRVLPRHESADAAVTISATRTTPMNPADRRRFLLGRPLFLYRGR